MPTFFDALSRTAGPVSARRQATAETFGGSSALAGLGKTMFDAGEFISQKLERDDITHVNRAMAEGGLHWLETLKARVGKAEPGAAGFTDTMKIDFDDWAGKGRDNITTKAGRDAWDLSAAKLKRDLIAKSIGFESKESARFIKASVIDGVDNVLARARIDPSYYESGDAQADLDNFEADLDARGLPVIAREVQAEQWSNNLAIAAANGAIANANTVIEAEELLFEIKNTNKWSGVLGNEAFSTMLKSATTNVVTLTSQRSKDESRELTAARRTNSERIFVAYTNATGPNPDPQALVDLDTLRTEALNDPEKFDLGTMRLLDGLLDNREKAALDAAALTVKVVAKQVDLNINWKVAGIELEIDRASDVATVNGLMLAFNKLPRKTTPDGTGVTPTEFVALKLKAMAKIDSLTKIGMELDKDAINRAAEQVDLNIDWTLADLELKVNKAQNVTDVYGLMLAFSKLPRKTTIDGTGVTHDEFVELKLKLGAKIDELNKVSADVDKDEAARLSKLNVSQFGAQITRAETSADVLEIRAALNSGRAFRNIEINELIGLRTKLFLREKEITKAASEEKEKEAERLAQLDYLSIEAEIKRIDKLDELITLSSAIGKNKIITKEARIALTSKLMDKADVVIKAIGDAEKIITDAENNLTVAKLDVVSQRSDLNSDDITNLIRQVDRLNDEGKIDLPKWVTIRARLDEGAIKAAQVLARAQSVEAALLGLRTLSPTSTEDATAVNEYYEASAPSWDKQSPQIAAANKVAFVGLLNILPDDLRDEITAGLSSQSSDDVVAAASLMQQLESVSPHVASQFGNTEAVSFGRQVLLYNQQGLSGDDAVTRTKELRNVPDADKIARRDVITSAKPLDELDIDSFFTDTVDDKIYGEKSQDAVVPHVMRAEFNAMVVTEFMRTGDIDVAKSSTLATFRKLWGAHYQAGDTFLMRRPPNLFYGEPRKTPQENSAWMMEQLMDDMVASGAFAEPLTESRVRITEHPTRTNGKLPLYQVVILPPKDQEGFSGPVVWGDPNGNPYAWGPTFPTSRQAVRDQELREAMISNSPAAQRVRAAAELKRLRDKGFFGPPRK